METVEAPWKTQAFENSVPPGNVGLEFPSRPRFRTAYGASATYFTQGHEWRCFNRRVKGIQLCPEKLGLKVCSLEKRRLD